MDAKICTKCREEKGLFEFYKHKILKDGLSCICKKCDSKQSKNWRRNNPEKMKQLNRNWYKNNTERAKKLGKIWRKNNPEKVKEIHNKYNKNNREKINEDARKRGKNNPEKFRKKQKIWKKNNYERSKEIKRNSWKKQYKINPDKFKERTKKWNENNIEKVRMMHNRYAKEKRIKCPRFKLRNNISNLIRARLKRRLLDKNNNSIINFLPYTIDELKQYLESKFEPWMSWNNYGAKKDWWTIDHIKPDSLFNYKSVEDKEFQECWALKNLQPMEFIKNIKKSNKII